MPLAPGTRLGPYEIRSALGAGGMGEVYEARDTRLDRVVAVKVLPAQVAGDVQFRARFEQEARTISQLDHPHICALYDVGHEQGMSFLVMQYLEGETLAERLTAGPLPLDEALRHGMEIADALDKAHRAGIVHRDVKPGNIMITKSGAKLLDFGLARSGVPVLASSGFSMLPTTPAANLTAQGTILGTFQYMAPEQLEGQEADARTDIFALGAVLYEMLTGRKAFEGKSQATLIASIVGSEPAPVSALLPVAPPLLDDVVRTCLAKDPNARWQSAADLVLALSLALKFRPSAALVQPTTRAPRSGRIAWGAAAAVTIAAAGAVGWLWLSRTTAPPARVSFDVDTVTAPSPLHLALSPDGSRLAAIVASANDGSPGVAGGTAIWLRRLDQVNPQVLAGTAGASFPFWSPDGRFLGFFAGGKLMKIDIFGGPTQVVCDASVGLGGSWNRDGVILFSPGQNQPIFRVSSAGGNPVAVTALDKARGDIVHRHPKFLPDGRHFVFLLTSTTPGKSGLYLGDVDSRETKRLVASDAMGSFVPPKYLVFMNGTTMMGQEFDLGRLELAGDPFPIADDVGINGANGVAGFTFSENGTLAFRTGGNLQQRVLRWVDRTGKELESVGAVGPHDNVRLAPDGKRIAELRIDAADRGAGDVWIYDLVRATSTRFTFNPAIDNSPVWSPDGRRIVFSSAKAGGIRDLYLKDAAGGGDEELILKSDFSKEPTDWSRDGRFILFTEQKNATDVWVLPLDGDRKPIPLLTTSFFESRARFSPDGRWIAYTSDETGSNQVYIQSFPQRAGKWQVSASGGQEPQWRADGRELFYSGGGAIWAVDVNTAGGTVVAGVPRKLFDGSVSQGSLLTRYAAAPDGSRFLLNVGVAQAANTVPPVRVVVNWTSGLNQR